MDSQSFRSKAMALKCPRCDSHDTKFCYYNNYNYSQPRHFCKSCRRYWTLGGVLRNVPVGGGTRKSKSSKPKPATTVADSPPSNSEESLSPPSRPLAGWIIENGRDCDRPAEKRARRSEGMVEILSGDDGSGCNSWFNFSALFNN